MKVEVGAGWDFSNTSKTTAITGICCHFLCRTASPPKSPPPQPLKPGQLDGFHSQELMKSPRNVADELQNESANSIYGERRKKHEEGKHVEESQCGSALHCVWWIRLARTEIADSFMHNLNKYWLWNHFTCDNSSRSCKWAWLKHMTEGQVM